MSYSAVIEWGWVECGELCRSRRILSTLAFGAASVHEWHPQSPRRYSSLMSYLSFSYVTLYNLFCPSHMSHLSFTEVTLMSFMSYLFFIYAIFVLRNVFYVLIRSSLMLYFFLLGRRHVWLNVIITQFSYCISGGLGTSWWPCHNVPGIKVNVCVSGDFPWALHNFAFLAELVWDRKILVMFRVNPAFEMANVLAFRLILINTW